MSSLSGTYRRTAAAESENEIMRRCLNPRRWTKQMSDAWHRAIPDLHKAFAELRKAAGIE